PLRPPPPSPLFPYTTLFRSAGSTVLVQGERLRGDVTRLRIGESVVAIQPADVSDGEIRAKLAPPTFPAGTLRAGVQGAQVVHLLNRKSTRLNSSHVKISYAV